MLEAYLLSSSVTSKKSPNVYKSCPKIIALEKLKTWTPLQKLPKHVGDLGELIVATGFEKLPKVQKIAQCGHTGHFSHWQSPHYSYKMIYVHYDINPFLQVKSG